MTIAQLVKREVKAFIKNPGFIIGLILMISFYGVLGNITSRVVESTAKEVTEANIGLVLEEDTRLVKELVKLLNTTTDGKIRVYESLDEAILEAGVGVVIPAGFTENATSLNKSVVLRGSVRVFTFSLTGAQARTSLLVAISSTIERLLPLAISATYNVSLQSLKPVLIGSSIFFYGKEISQEEFLSITTFISLTPLFVSLILGINATYAAQLVAVEKVEKAFEMLLVQPIRRRNIVLAKILGASIASILFGAVYLVGVLTMFIGVSPDITTTVGTEQVLPITVVISFLGPELLGVIMLSLVIGLIFSGTIGVIVGSMVSDERIAGGLVAPVMFIFVGIGFLTMLMGLPLNPLSAVLAGLTITPLPYVYAVSIFSGETSLIMYSIIVAAGTCSFLIYIASTIFNRDIVVLGLRISWSRKAREKM
ncbi:MAG: ABC transporter permease [Desulfurococcaceae archaeon TW002]